MINEFIVQAARSARKGAVTKVGLFALLDDVQRDHFATVVEWELESQNSKASNKIKGHCYWYPLCPNQPVKKSILHPVKYHFDNTLVV